MNKLKVGDKVKVKENFWEIEGGVSTVCDDKKKLAGRTLEVESVHSNGIVLTKQDDSDDDTGWNWKKNWVELYAPIITWDTLKWKDVLVHKDGSERMVLDVRNDLVDLSDYESFDRYKSTVHKKELQKLGYTIKQATPTPETETKMTIAQIEEKLNIAGLKIIK